MKNFTKFAISFFVFMMLFQADDIKAQPRCYPKTIYLVRHAEKMKIPGERDPGLTKQGHKRALSLSKRLSTIKLDAVYATQFKRTLQTVQPTAKQQSLDIEIRDAASSATLAEDILEACNENILIAGHSNTVPALLKALGLVFTTSIQGKELRFKPEIYLNEKQDYGTLFRVTFKPDGTRNLDLSVF